jgi:hypothetical protein
MLSQPQLKPQKRGKRGKRKKRRQRRSEKPQKKTQKRMLNKEDSWVLELLKEMKPNQDC